MTVRGTHVEFKLTGPAYGTALIADDDSVWIAVRARWWDLATWIWWWLSPFDRKAIVVLRVGDGIGGITKVRARAVRVSKRYVRVRNLGKVI